MGKYRYDWLGFRQSFRYSRNHLFITASFGEFILNNFHIGSSLDRYKHILG